MAVTVSRYNHTVKKLLNNEINYSDLFWMLLNNSASFTATHTSIDDVAGADSSPARANEVFGNGWTEGGELLANCAVTVVNTNDAKIDADDISVLATGGSIGPAYKAALYEKTSGDALLFIDFGQVEEAGEGTDFKVIFNANGIIITSD